ncbi:MAG TPA: hypothetical protein VI197_25680 [Polyangiaceae bacterium]
MFDEDPTKRYRTVASIVLASDDAKQIGACTGLAEQLAVHFKHCEVGQLGDVAAHWRPFALLVSERLHAAAAPDSIEGLAREYNATLIVLSDSLPETELTKSLAPTLKQLLRKHFA